MEILPSPKKNAAADLNGLFCAREIENLNCLQTERWSAELMHANFKVRSITS